MEQKREYLTGAMLKSANNRRAGALRASWPRMHLLHLKFRAFPSALCIVPTRQRLHQVQQLWLWC